jgi:hypothetical protein
MSNVIDISSAHPLVALIEGIKQSAMKGELTSCVILMKSKENQETAYMAAIDPDDEFEVIGVLEKIKLEVLLGVGAEDDD